MVIIDNARSNNSSIDGQPSGLIIQKTVLDRTLSIEVTTEEVGLVCVVRQLSFKCRYEDKNGSQTRATTTATTNAIIIIIASNLLLLLLLLLYRVQKVERSVLNDLIVRRS